MSVIEVQLRTMRLRTLNTLRHARLLQADKENEKVTDALQEIIDAIMDQETRITRLEEAEEK